jgi:hypothetical protein
VKHFSCHLSDEFVSYPNSSCMISYDDLSRKIGQIVIFFARMNIWFYGELKLRNHSFFFIY